MQTIKNFKKDPKTGAIINISKEKPLEQRVALLEKEVRELRLLLLKGESDGRRRPTKID